LASRIKALQAEIDNARDANDPLTADDAQRRLNMINGRLAAIHVGDQSDIAQLELKDRFDDAVSAVRCALQEGWVPGGGNTLVCASKHLRELFESRNKLEGQNKSFIKGYLSFASVLQYPFFCIHTNAGVEFKDGEALESYLASIAKKDDEGKNHFAVYEKNTFTPVVVDKDFPVKDPAAVVLRSLEIAASVASTVITTDVTMTINEEALMQLRSLNS
jgi:chaperonin GroEL